MPADKWVASVEYGLWDYDTKLGTKATFVADQERLPTDDTTGPYDNYTLVDLYVTWEPSEKLTGLKVDFSVINATDENYRQAWTQVYNPGRSFRIAGQYNF
jgi:hemoglobin/transferrin/lactoferrin receptor protein